MSPQPPLTVHNAEIHTASVEIKTLTLKGKQVTLAVFRQLRETPLIANDGTLNGVPWGVVNYHPDKCANNPPHWHVVWQSGNDLSRSYVEVDPHYPTFECEEGDMFLASHVRDVLRGGSKYFGGKMPSVGEGRVYYPAGREASFPVSLWMSLSPHEKSILRSYNSEGVSSWAQGIVDEMLRRLDERLGGKSADPAMTARLCEAYKAAVQDEEARRQRHREVRASLAELPQLFIAV
ncbi:hypothetical protein [Actinoplanes sp. NPDC026623]|uniref:hypothetical protein n=1 Tax=Actinoplanes sp. NPDC026623 TaxID=3155610 RepID=UPI0033DCE5FF